jgi:hypothetical protein
MSAEVRCYKIVTWGFLEVLPQQGYEPVQGAPRRTKAALGKKGSLNCHPVSG